MSAQPIQCIRKTITAVILATLLVGISPLPALQAQTTSGTVLGQVFDRNGAPVAGARVSIVNERSGNPYTVITDANGTYRRPFIPPGSYRVTATKAGFTESSVTVSVPLNGTRDIRPPDITINPVGAATPSTQPTQPSQPTQPQSPPPTTQTPPAPGPAAVESDSSAAINRNDAQRGANFTELQVQSLPLGGAAMRSFDELALLAPGVAPPPYTPGVRGPGIGFGIGTAGQFSVNGHRARSNNFSVDGSDNNDPDVGVRRQGFVALVPQSIESIQEFQISTLLWSTELGRNMGSQVNAVSKAGGNQFHGQAYGFFTHDSLNARNFFDYTGGASGGENPFTRLQAGFAIGGPIVRNRTQFFAGYEFLKIRSSIEQHFTTLTPGERNLGVDTFAVQDNANPFYVTGLGATPIGLNVFSLYPLPNNPGGPFGLNTYSEVLPADGKGSIASFRITHQLSPDHALNGRYNFTDDNRILPSINQAIRSTIHADTRTQNLSLILDSTLRTSLFNQARFSYGRTRLDFPEFATSPFTFNRTLSNITVLSDCNGNPNDFEFCNATSTTGPLGQVVVTPYSAIGVDPFTFPQARVNNTFQFADSMSWSWMDHSFRFGADIRRYQLNSSQDRLYRPQLVYGSGVLVPTELTTQGNQSNFIYNIGNLIPLTGAQLAAAGIQSSILQTFTRDTPNSRIGLRFTEYNFFFNDNWRIRPNFTLDYGIRYEYNTVPKEVNNVIENAVTLQNLPTAGTYPFEVGQTIAAYNAAVAAYRRVLGDRSGIYDADRNNVGPRLGFSWAPDLKTAVRAGYGIYYDTILGAVVSQSRNVFPNELPINIDPTLSNTITLFNPTTIGLVRDNSGNPINPAIPLLRPGSNQLGGDFALLAGALFSQFSLLGGGLAFTLPERKLKTPYSQHWHLTLEREFLTGYLASAAYVGTKGTNLTRLTTPNLGPNVTPFIPFVTRLNGQELASPLVAGSLIPQFASLVRQAGFPLLLDRPIPELGAFQRYENSASSTYHSMQLELRKRFSAGYTYTVAYTWSHALDGVSDVFPIAGAPILPQDSLDLSLERGDANFDVRHRFAASLVWDLPFYRNSTSDLATVLGGWQVATTVQANSGQPFTLNLYFDANLDGNLTDRPSTTEGLIFFEGHGSRRVAIAEGRRLIDFFNPGQNGGVGRNTVRGDNFINWDLALNKNFRFGEYQNLEFRTELFNVLNRANFGIPVRVIGSPGFGASYDTANPARIIQFALRYSF